MSPSAHDFERKATAAYMAGRHDDYALLLERAHADHREAGQPRRASRCAFWLGLHHALRDEMAQASGWFGRAGRLIEDEECVEQGYLLLPRVLQAQAGGDWDVAAAAAERALEVAGRFDDRDLATLALHAKGLSHVRAGRLDEGLGLLDEAMVAVIAGELSPLVSGLVYCSVLEGCRDAFEIHRAAEWTSALAAWCEGQPDLVAFSGECLMHRADILRLSGAWSESLAEAERARARFEQTGNPGLRARAWYQQGEVMRLRGEIEASLALYARASRDGYEPQPGLALLRLAQGDADSAEAAIRRAAGETRDPLGRARLLPAFVVIMLAAGDVEAAREASEELSTIAESRRTDLLAAMAASARGAVSLAEGDGWNALVALRTAGHLWQALDAPYENARGRELIGLACAAVGDAESARLELEAARVAFERLGAALDASRVRSRLGSGDAGDGSRTPGAGEASHPLTDREVEVLRLVAAGRSNREIAAELVISEHTVARHLQNIFAKIDVSSRTAAAAYAFEHGLM